RITLRGSGCPNATSASASAGSGAAETKFDSVSCDEMTSRCGLTPSSSMASGAPVNRALHQIVSAELDMQQSIFVTTESIFVHSSVETFEVQLLCRKDRRVGTPFQGVRQRHLRTRVILCMPADGLESRPYPHRSA